jgi:hypothetical protein
VEGAVAVAHLLLRRRGGVAHDQLNTVGIDFDHMWKLVGDGNNYVTNYQKFYQKKQSLFFLLRKYYVLGKFHLFSL